MNVNVLLTLTEHSNFYFDAYKIYVSTAFCNNEFTYSQLACLPPSDQYEVCQSLWMTHY